MVIRRCRLLIMCWVLFVGCGPDTIFLRPGLDTPQQHVSNGHQFLEHGKVMDACREFKRAKELDPQFIEAYIGLGIALGYKGDFQEGLENLQRASQMAGSASEREAVQKGMEQLKQMQSTK